MRGSTQRRPVIIQGGMGVGVSSWRVAQAVARTGQLGVVSGTALDAVLARTLQDGDPGGHVRRALRDFPLPPVAERVLDRYHLPGGRGGAPYRVTPKPAIDASRAAQELAVVGNFVEVWLAKQGHSGLVGINFLEKIQSATPAAAYGAMIAGVDVVLMGAGIPREIPCLLDDLAAQRPGTVHVDVAGHDPLPATLTPASLGGDALPPLRRPAFLAIVSSHVLAQYLNREESTRPDGFVVEGPRAGGHNAPPRGRLTLDDTGQPVYGPRDEADLAALGAIGLPFWLAGGYGEPERVRAALATGAAGVQVGTLFALCRESGLDEPLREALLHDLRGGRLAVRTDPSASPTGFPFKVAAVTGTLAEPDVYATRPRLCDLGYLRQAYERADRLPLPRRTAGHVPAQGRHRGGGGRRHVPVQRPARRHRARPAAPGRVPGARPGHPRRRPHRRPPPGRRALAARRQPRRVVGAGRRRLAAPGDRRPGGAVGAAAEGAGRPGGRSFPSSVPGSSVPGEVPGERSCLDRDSTLRPVTADWLPSDTQDHRPAAAR
jgi:NAD(P)H-dependent flavin oxidoreductase YrpB (nitropropane dioxygenase family)